MFRRLMKEKKNQNTENTELDEIAQTHDDKIELNENNEKASTQSETDLTETLKKEIEEQKDKYIRLYSEFDNFRRRVIKEKADLINLAGQDILKSLLTIIDDMERAEKSANENAQNDIAAEGIKLILNKFKNILEQHGLKEYNSTGEVFNEELHEAISKIPAPDNNLKGKIVDEIEKGYKLKEKVIRFAKVIVGE